MIEEALNSLGIKDWILRDTPKNEVEFNNMFFKIIGVSENETVIESSNPNDFGVTWTQVQAKITELEAAKPLRLLRLERNRLLQETDWIATIDYPGSPQVQNLWLDYRQALRDLPATAEPQLDEFGNLINVEWPTPPENS